MRLKVEIVGAFLTVILRTTHLRIEVIAIARTDLGFLPGSIHGSGGKRDIAKFGT
jgi:hypothetical protein